MAVGGVARGGSSMGMGETRVGVMLLHGRLSVSPDPVVVQAGSIVTWLCSSEWDDLTPLRWEVYFDHGPPGGVDRLETVSGTPTVALIPTDPGEWKYGVRALDAATRHVLADDDPTLVVVPR